MRQVDKISIAELQQMAEEMYGDLVKADVDLAKKVLVVGLELHSDGEAYLSELGSKRADLWGINLFPGKFGTKGFIEFDSMINFKADNRSRFVEDEQTRAQITEIVEGIVHG